MAAVRSKAEALDKVAEEAVRMIDVERLFKNPKSADKIFAQIVRCDDFVETQKPAEPDVTFSTMALELTTLLIQYATDLNALDAARQWLANRGFLSRDSDDTITVLAKLTLVHTINRGAQRYPKDERWSRMKRRLEEAKQLPRAA
jgi:hypothetical protein